uniref:SCF E3 ubiquitin ligase complex F-box protein grrA n=1 Tax=Talaromyces marneffei PM1 TaxID=1077442 RepID=A0A093VL98_TALMA
MHRSRAAARSSSKAPSESSTSSSPERAADDDTDFFAQANDSQSSIGVGTFREQIGSNEPDIIIPPIGRLPPEILISVFSKLSSPSDMLHCMLVSRKWAANCVGILWHRPSCNRTENLRSVVTSVGKSESFFPYSELIRRLNLASLASKITDGELSAFTQCKRIERLTLTNCSKLTDKGVSDLVEGNRHLQALDVSELHALTDNFFRSVTALLSTLRNMRELRLAQCVEIDDSSFLRLPPHSLFESLRALDLTACEQIRDDAIERITDAAPRLRHLVLNKCRFITDRAVLAICKLGKNLHLVHLGHCSNITDAAVSQLVKSCNRIRYIDLACCNLLTDASVQQLATLPKLKRIGLVKCQAITDWSILALARSRALPHSVSPSCLERVHLSYCVNLTMEGIHALLNFCPRLTHLSLTGVQAFLHEDLTAFCRDAPPEFTQQQREVFCVFSGEGVMRLRDYLNRNVGPFPSETEATMYDDEDELDEEENQVTGLMSAAAIRDDDDDDMGESVIEVGPPTG